MNASCPIEPFIFAKSLDLLDKLSTYVHKSVVFADNKFAEILHWHGGASLLLDFGAINIKEFSSFENGEKTDQKGTFFLASPLIGDTRVILRDIINYSCFQDITIITNIHPAMQAVVNFKAPTDEAAFEVNAILENQIAHLMREKTNENVCSCHVIYVPLVAASVLPNLFVTPAHSSLFPLLPTDLHLLMTRHKLANQSELSFEHLPKQLQLKHKLLVSSLNSLLELMNLSEDVFALGTTSNIIASELAALPWSRIRRKSSARKASLLIIDRTLDMGNIVHHNFESLLDKIINVLPRLPGHTVDVGVDMTPVTDVRRNENFGCVAPGCLAHPGNHKYSSLLNALALLKQKEVISELNRRLVEALEREGLYEKSSHLGTLDSMEHYISLFKNQSVAIKKHSPLLQLSLAVVQTLRCKNLPSTEQLAVIEKRILESFNDAEGDLTNNIILEVLKDFRKMSDGRLEDLLNLLLYVFSLDEDKRWRLSSKEETLLEKELMELFLEAKKSGNSKATKLIEQCRNEMECLSVVQDLIDKLKGFSSAKSCLQRYKHAVEKGSVTTPSSYKPIIKQVVQDIFDPNKPELVDIIHKSTTFGDLIKSGFGFFRGSNTARPNDHPLLIIFIIGGVNASEVKQLRDILGKVKPECQVLIGGTVALTANDLLGLALLQDNLND